MTITMNGNEKLVKGFGNFPIFSNHFPSDYKENKCMSSR
ncbi:hypothetical protein ADICYQ_1929 [Cyclobacterium qasimii M12-11B]|uniref:Uncharacterized protein n=1 Tax=Cyclobacterium qasimii M12-11B TaxID=641524 RepID=S7VHN0_9BACT|nr:hypothetical protein ADICYQ_1929 [Cyclobacterium qasimii M12-11B]